MARPKWLAPRGRATQSSQVVPSDTMTQSVTRYDLDLWDEMVSGYLATHTKHTRESYVGAIRRWTEWCLIHGVDPTSVTRKHIDVWMLHLNEEAGLADRTIAGYVGTICSLYAYAHSHDMIDHNPGAYVRRPRTPRVSATLSLTPTETADLLDAARAAEPWLDAYVHVLALNGTRSGETRRIQIEHLGMHGDIPTVHLPHRKGGGVSTLALAEPTWRAVRRAKDDRENGPLLVHTETSRSNGVAVGRNYMRRRLAELLSELGIERRITAHSLRHGFVTMSLDAGCHIRDIMASTGHTDPSMVTYYDRGRAAIERNTTHAVAAFVAEAREGDIPENNIR